MEGDTRIRMELDSIGGTFKQASPRLAVFDKELRERLGQWTLDQSIDLSACIATFATNAGFHSDTGDVCIPTHEHATPELTGEFLLVRQGPDGETVAFHDFSTGSKVEYDVDTIETLYPAWRVRFWTDAFSHQVLPSETHPTPGEPTPIQLSRSVPDPADHGEGGDGFFDELVSFLDRERRATRAAAARDLDRLDQHEVGTEHPGIPTLVPRGRRTNSEGHQVVDLEIPPGSLPRETIREAYDIYEDCEVRVMDHSGTDRDGFPVEATVETIAAPEITLRIDWATSENKTAAEQAFDDPQARFGIGLLFNPISIRRQRAAIDAVAAAATKRALVLGNANPTFARLTKPIYDGALDPSQKRAVRRGLAAEDVFCIHGPPGTGKTRTLVTLLGHALENHERVLACSHSNQAIDNLVAGDSTKDHVDYHTLHGLAQRASITVSRVGNNSDHPVVEDRYTEVPYYEADVVATTMNAAHRFRSDQFDLVVVDEAAQATIPSSLIPLVCGNRLVMAGDHKQLPPYHASELDDTEAMEVSLFERLLAEYDDQIYTRLQTQYRMHPAIARFPNEEFYGGTLEDADGTEDLTIGELSPVAAIDIRGTEQQAPTGSYANPAEAQAVVEEVTRLKRAGVSYGNIGVITPYSAQVDDIDSRLRTRSTPGPSERIAVDTIDGFQGGERTAIIVSFVRSNEDGRIGFLGFPHEGPRRLTVALTRAKRRLVLIGNWETLTAPPRDTDASSRASRVYQRLYERLKRHEFVRSHPG